MRKTVSAGFVFLTGVLLVMLSVLPHHHHGDRICFTSIQSCVPEQDEIPCGECAHDQSEADCDLRYLLILYSRGNGTCIVSADQSTDDDTLFSLPFLFVNVEFACRLDATPVGYIPFVVPVAIRFSGSLPLLRAPPVFIA